MAGIRCAFRPRPPRPVVLVPFLGPGSGPRWGRPAPRAGPPFGFRCGFRPLSGPAERRENICPSVRYSRAWLARVAIGLLGLKVYGRSGLWLEPSLAAAPVAPVACARPSWRTFRPGARFAPPFSGRNRASGPRSGSTVPRSVSRPRGQPFAAGLLPMCCAQGPRAGIFSSPGPGARALPSAPSGARRSTPGLSSPPVLRSTPASWRRSLTSPGPMRDSSLPVWRWWQGVCPGGLACSRLVSPRESPGLHALPPWGLPDPGGG